MKTMIITKNKIEGFHFYSEAPKNVSFLKNNHRHIFYIECRFEVKNLNREIEIFTQQKSIESYIKNQYGIPAQFEGLSCEMIAVELLKEFNCSYVKVLEDGEGGAVIQR